jgi:cell division topological specificity factor
MKLLSLFRRRGSAPQARERLQILLSHERAAGRQPDLLAILQEEILATIARQITVERENVRVRIDRGATVSTLEIDVDIPHTASSAAAAFASNRSAQATGIVRGALTMAGVSRGFG